MYEGIELFDGMKKDEIESVLPCLKAIKKTYKKNEIIIFQGEEVSSIGVVLNGSVNIYKDYIDGSRILIGNIGIKQMFAESIVCSKITKSPVNVIAAECCEILWLSFSKITSMCCAACTFHSRLIQNIIKIVSKKNIYLKNRLQIIAKKSLREKIMEYLKEESLKHNSLEFEINLNRSQLAEYLASDRSALSRELSKMKEENIIDYKSNKFTLQNHEN